MNDLWARLKWVATGREARPVVAFEWIRGRVGSRENPDGMRSLIHAGVVLAIFCAGVDLFLLWRQAWANWMLLGFLHLAWISAVGLLTVLNVGFLETIDGRQMVGLGGPNLLTLARGFLLPSLLYMLATGDYVWGAAAYALIQFTDVLDGWWARRTGQQSKLGIVLDPMMDLLLHLGVLAMLALTGLLSDFVLLLVIVRSGLLVFGTLLFYFWKGQVWIHPTPLGKGTGFLLTVATTSLVGLTALEPAAVVPDMIQTAGSLGAAAVPPDWALTLAGVLRTSITVLLCLAVAHVLTIGIVNLKMPAVPFESQRKREWRRRHLGHR